MFPKFKIRTCSVCGLDMKVPKTSGRLRCELCGKEIRRIKAKEWYTGHIRECRVAAMHRARIKRIADPTKALLARVKSRSTKKGIKFDLTITDIVIPKVCPVLGTPFTYGTYYAASLDRVDNTKGYVKGNVQVLSHKANAMKNSANIEELKAFAKWVDTTYGK